MNRYNILYNPLTNKYVSTNSLYGKYLLHNYLQRGGIISSISECLGALCPKNYGQIDEPDYDRIRHPTAEQLRRRKKYFDSVKQSREEHKIEDNYQRHKTGWGISPLNMQETDYKAYQDSKKIF